ncbi:MAG: branched-chain amino acid ABC transporter permease [Alphaproteobacteria bacterium]|nr:branched-chain amino acid ABC transporter permease [Alphaproteobacteria bacterium]
MQSLIETLSAQFAWMQNPVVIARQALAGLSNGMLLFLIASGLSLIFGVLRIINFAHGALFMFGAFAAVTLTGLVPEGLAGFAGVLIGATAGLAVLGAAIETGLLRRIYLAPHEFQLLLTFALVFILGDAVKLIWGREDHSVSMPEILSGSTQALGVTFPTYRLFLIGAGIFIAIGLWALLHKTRWGIFVRAATMDRAMLGSLGVDTRRLFTTVFVLGAALAGLGGALAAPVVSIGPGLHVQVIIDAFVVVVIGGMGSVAGAFVAALLVGLVNAFGILAFPGLSVVLTFALMAVVLIVRPWGLFGSPE